MGSILRGSKHRRNKREIQSELNGEAEMKKIQKEEL
jgi:hypothetical protein